MKLNIEINLDNSAFSDNVHELERIFNYIWEKLPYPYCSTPSPVSIYDTNGNKVGSAEITEI